MGYRITKLVISVFVMQIVAVCSLAIAQTIPDTNNPNINLLQRYPTTLITGCTKPSKARKWEFSKEDIYFLSEFPLKIGNTFEIKIGTADVGIGHCIDGAVWAIVIPRESGTLSSSASTESEPIDNLWLRFHPAEIITLFPKSTVKIAGDEKLWTRMLKIANAKIQGSWQASGRAMIPGHNDLTVDADTKKGKRRFFVVDIEAATARYVSAFENRIVPEGKPCSKNLAESSFDQLWDEYDRKYAMFTLRPEINWEQLREQYRPQAIKCTTAYEFALVCAEMLKHLRDLHIWVKVDGQNIPVFNRPRERNANPLAFEAIIGKLSKVGKRITWGKTAEKVGFIAIDSWSGNVDEKFDEVLENMRDTRGLIIDVRLNGGGSEPLAKNVAGRFVDKEYIYAYSQYRNGPNHIDLTEKYPRRVETCGPWRYDRPVVLLMGQKCMSSNESFVSMMAECPQVTTMGDRTCGSSGNPKFLDLPAGVRVSLPQWIDLLPDGTPLDKRGVQPDEYFPTKPEYFEDNCDDLLKAALYRLSEIPFPSKPIVGPSIESVRKIEDAKTPHVINFFPPNNAENVEPNTSIRIRFDRPMDPEMVFLGWKGGTHVDIKDFKYDEGNDEFVITAKLNEGTQYNLVVNPHGRKGFIDRRSNIAKEFNWRFQTKNTAIVEIGNKPIVKSINPVSGSKIALITKLRLTFDQPMHPDQYEFFDHTAKSCYVLYRNVEYDPVTHQFTIPVVFPPNYHGTIEFRGFKSVKGVKADSIKIEYSTSKDIFPQNFTKSLNSKQKFGELKNILEKIKQIRSSLKSLYETVYIVSSSHNYVRSNYAIFKMQGNKQFYANISNIMNAPFYVGSDGKNCWWYHEKDDEEILIMVPFDEIDEKNVIICDPFLLIKNDAITSIQNFNVEYLGARNLGEKMCHIIRSWSASIGSSSHHDITNCEVRTYWLDSQTYMPVQIERNSNRLNVLYRFNYKHINGTFKDSSFRPDFITDTKPKNVKTVKWQQLEEGFDKRFVDIKDGSGSTLSVRWGICGSKGRKSSGLN